METLRERDTSLLRTAPERELSARPGKHDHSRDTLALTPETTANYPNGAQSAPAPAPVPGIVSQDRFALDYTDPLFPCKSVSYALLKRTLDILVALFVLTLTFPIMAIVALIIKLTSRGPIIFKQVRVGRGGRHFWCYKFRSMCADAEAKKKELMHLNEASGPVFKIKRDPRITPIGAFIRKFSIDELPQLFNVLRGDMSLVGPRPPIPSEVALYGPRERGRLAVQPGLTCLWQVSGRSNVSFEHWVELDLLYIDTMSFTNDLKILVRTIPAVVTGSGAH